MKNEKIYNQNSLSSDVVRKDQIEYRKWIISITMFVLTVSLGIIGVIDDPINSKWLLILGWAFLGLCILLNWLIIKRLVSISLLTALVEEDPTFKDFLESMKKTNIQYYAFIQNISFLFGVLFVGVGFILNL